MAGSYFLLLVSVTTKRVAKISLPKVQIFYMQSRSKWRDASRSGLFVFFSENTAFLYWLVHRAIVHHQNLFDFPRFRPHRKLRIELKLQFQPLEFSQRRDHWLLQCLMLFCEFDKLELRKICWKGSTELLLLLFFTGARRRYPKSKLVILFRKLLLTAESWNCGRRHWYTLPLINHSGENICPWRFVKRKKSCRRICSWKTRV